VNEEGFPSDSKLTVYCSSETHSSIEKDVKIAGYGRKFLRKVEVDDTYAINPKKLEDTIRKDLQNGFKPTCVIATLGTTGSTAIDPLEPIARICKKYEIFLHVDAAYAGTALLLPEMRWMSRGVEHADSFVFNPHKWMFTNFDCSVFFVQDEELLVRTFEILPEYLKTPQDRRVKNYRDWGIQLGRRFRALKLWFVIRSFGVDGLRQKIRKHLELTQQLKATIEQDERFELLAPVHLNALCFRYHPPHIDDEEKLDELNRRLLTKINETGQLFMTHTKLRDVFTIRMIIGNTNVNRHHVENAWNLVVSTSELLV
jgi:aromatic-L-amino-acid decarboxylase